MSITAAALRELHRIHQQLGDLRDRLERGPKQVRLREASVTQLEAKLAEAKEKAKQMQIAADRKNLELKSGEQKVFDLRAKLNAASSNKEYQALLEQIAAAEMAGSVLSDEILEAFEKIDQLRHRGQGSRTSNSPPASRNWRKARRAVQDTAASITADIKRLEAELATAEKSLPADLKADYQRVVRSKGADSLAIADDGTCTGCGQSITLNMQNELRLAKLVFCKSCGRILYLPGE